MKKSKSVALSLAILMASLAVAPGVNSIAHASGLEINEDTLIKERKPDIEIDKNVSADQQKLEIAEVRGELTKAQKSVEDVEAADEKYEECLKQFDEAVRTVSLEIDDYEQSVQNGSLSQQKGVAGGSIYDLTTIPVRVQLLVRIGRAIRFGSTELSNKVVAAHTKLTEYILTGILYAANPFANEGQIMDYIDRFEALEQELLAYPDLSPEDIATIYKKAAYHRTIREARKVRNEANRTGRKFQAKVLDKEISKAASLWWRITVTCGELDAEEEKLIAAIEKVAGPKIRAEKIEFMEGEAGAINIDNKTKIRPVIMPAEVKNKDYLIYSSNPYVARVIGNEIIPLKTGNVIITVMALDNGITKDFELQILNPGESSSLPMLEPTGANDQYLRAKPNPVTPAGPVHNVADEVKDITFSVKSVEMKLDESYQLGQKVLVFPERAVDKSLTYQVANPEIANIDENGNITALNPGTTEVSVTSANGIKKTIKVNVADKPVEKTYEITNIEISPRKAGVFTIGVEATEDGKAYNGPCDIKLVYGDKAINHRIYLKNGKASKKYTGFDIPTWQDEVLATVNIKDISQEIEIAFN
ncbi:CAMP factor family pore-forming toxin [Anaerococcus sp.]|uniref:CAMP factor family pore-forming toxin n=1 Tax=Anaerococcus sp. TaxID=1872515 RepID=UPI0028FE2E14|nr:CAMP factor family pore-forming toxin [Anaerococcus sp.]MDU2598628.1 CAMP factor family pore-forming toxin [Anaerococcus sp.]